MSKSEGPDTDWEPRSGATAGGVTAGAYEHGGWKWESAEGPEEVMSASLTGAPPGYVTVPVVLFCVIVVFKSK